MGVSEVAYGDRTIMSITDSTVTEDTLADGAVAYGADGERIVGKMTMGHPVGHEWITMNPNIPTGCLPLFGGTYSRTAYADLWTWLQTQTGYLITEAEWQEKAAANGGNVSCYSDGDGSTTFRVPSRSCWVKGANNTEEVGSYLAAGLPNITGTASAFRAMNGYAHLYTGALYDAGNSSKSDQANTGAYSSSFGIDASLSSPVYGASDTVQPPSLVGMWVVQAFGSVSNAGNQDIADISSGLAVAETRIGALENNAAAAYVVESWREGTEWYRIWSDGTIEQGGQTEATAGSTARTINLYNAYADTDYSLILGSGSGGSGSLRYNNFQWTEKTTNTFTAKAECTENIIMNWSASGKGA